MTKKLLTIITALFVALSVIPVGVSAEETTEEETPVEMIKETPEPELTRGKLPLEIAEKDANEGRSSEGEAYAVTTQNEELVFFRSYESYENLATGTFVDINGNEYTGRVYSDIENSVFYNSNQIPWYWYGDYSIKSVRVAEGQKITPISTRLWFYSQTGVQKIDLTGLDTSNVTDMSRMFFWCYELKELNIRDFDTSKVTNMESMFSDCRNLVDLDLSNFDTSKVTDMGWMFYSCMSLVSLDLSNFDTGNVVYMTGMFHDCNNLINLNLSGFDTSKVTTMESMFCDCSSLVDLDLSSFDTSNVGDENGMGYMFAGCSSLTSLDLSSFDTSNVKAMYGMFMSCKKLTELNLKSFDTSNVTYMGTMFSDCSGLTELDLSGFDTSSVIYMSGMFSGCSGLTELDLSGFDTSKVDTMYGMFCYCTRIRTIWVSEKWSTKSIRESGRMFENCPNLPNYDETVVDHTKAHYGEGGYLTLKGEEPGILRSMFMQEKEQCIIDYNEYFHDITQKDVLFSIKDGEDIIDVDNRGVVTALQCGSALLELTEKNGGAVIIRVTVTENLSIKSPYFSGQRDGWPLLNAKFAFSDNSNEFNFDGKYNFVDYYGWGPNASVAVSSLFKRLQGKDGYCFGLSITAIGNYLGKMNLKQYFPEKSGKYLNEFGYTGSREIVYSSSLNNQLKRGNAYYINDSNLIKIIEKLHLSQYSTEFKSCELKTDKTYQSIIEHLKNHPEQPLLIGDVANKHAYVTDTSHPLLYDDNWIGVYCYDTKATELMNPLSYPMEHYAFLPTILWMNPDTGEYQYQYNGTGYRANFCDIVNLIGRNIRFYNISELSRSFYQAADFTLSPYYNTFIKTSDAIIENATGLPIVKIKDGIVEYIDENVEYYPSFNSSLSENEKQDMNGYFIFKDEISELNISGEAELAVLTNEGLSALSVEKGNYNVDLKDSHRNIKVTNTGDDISSFKVIIAYKDDDCYTLAQGDLNGEKQIEIGYSKDEVTGQYVNSATTNEDTDKIHTETFEDGIIKEEDFHSYASESQEISLSEKEAVINAGSNKVLIAKTLSDEVRWTSSDEKIATVDQNGTVKGIKPGYATITATTSNGLSASCKVRVLFTDIPAEGKYYSNPVYWAVEEGITNGYTDSDGIIRTFKPQNNCTREAVVTFLWRLAGKPEPKNLNSPFSDVQDKGKYYYKAVLWAAELGITKGYQDGTFKPNATCLREHVVTFLWRYAKQPTPKTTKNPFNDVSTSDYYYKATLWANENKIANGYSSGAYAGGFGPKLDCLREHVVTFLYRYAK